MKKRILSLVLVFSIVFTNILSGVLPVFAVTNELLITDCEMLDGWTKTGGNALAINANGFTGSAIHCDIGSGAFRTATYTASEPVDISRYQNLTWDSMFYYTGAQPGLWDAIVAAYGDQIYVKIGSSEGDYNIYRLSKMTVEQDAGNNLWYHFSIDLDDPTSATGTFDSTAMTTFYFSTVDGIPDSTIGNGAIRLDNIYVRNKRPIDSSTLTDFLFAECDTLDGWTYEGNAANIAINANGMPGNAIQVYAGYGAVRRLTYTTSADLEGYNTIEFEMRVALASAATTPGWDEVAAAYKDSIKFEISDGAAVNVYKLDKWQITELDNCWYHVVIDLTNPSTTTGTLDLSEFESLTVYTAPNSAALDMTLTDRNFRFDSFIAHYEPDDVSGGEPEEPTVETVVIADGSETSNWSYAGNASGFASNQDRSANDPGRSNVVWVSGGRGALRKLTFTPDLATNLTGGLTLEWDMQAVVGAASGNYALGQDIFEEMASVYESKMAVALKDADGQTAILGYAGWTVSKIDGTNWRHIAVSLKDAQIDLGNIVEIFFYTARNDDGNSDPLAPEDFPTTFFRFDDVIAMVDPNAGKGEDPTGSVVITDCDSVSDWSSEMTTSGLSVGAGKGIDGGDAVHAQGGYGLLRKLTYNPAETIDLKDNTTLEWDLATVCGVQGDPNYAQGQEMFEIIAKAYCKYIGVEVSDGTTTAVIGYDKWQIGEVNANNHRHFAVSLEGYGLNLSAIDSISFYVMKNDAGGTPDTTLPSAVFYRFDNIIATTNTVIPNGSIGDEEKPTGPIIISDGSSIENWTLERGTLLTNTNQGLPAPSMQVGAGNGALRKLTYTGSLNLTDYPTIEWDWFIMNESTTEDALETVLKSYRITTAVEVSDGTTTVTLNLDQWEMVSEDGLWRHFAVSLADTELNLSQIKTISFYTCPVDGGMLDASLPIMIYRFDNIEATDKAVNPNMAEEDEPDDESKIMIDQCEDLENWSYEQASQTLINNTGRNGKAVQVFTGYGALRRITYTEPVDSGRDFSEYHQIGFDFRFLHANTAEPLWTTVANVYKNYIGVEISDGTNTEKLKLADMVITELEGGWYHACVEVPSDSKVDLSKFAAFTFYALPIGLGNPDTSLPNMNFQIDNLAAYKSAGHPSKKVVTSTYFSDGMMFQQNKPMNIFGNVGAADVEVKAELLDKNGFVIETKEVVSAASGSFSLAFDGHPGSYDKYSINLYTDNVLTQVIRDILIGELWLTAGQSNMEYYVIQAMPTYDTPIPTNEYVRFFEEPTVPGGVDAILPAAPATDIPDAFWNDGSVGTNAKYVSAIGYFMSLQLQEKLDVPVGFIHAAKGASLIESWLPREVIENNDVIKSTLEARGLYLTDEALENKSANWESLTTLYNTKIAPLAGINIAGMLWYHGESNVKYADENGDNTFYAEAIKALIENYSKDFGFDGDMPFVFAHLAPHDYSTAGGRAQDYPTILANFSEMLSEATAEVDAQVIQLPLYDLSLQYKDPPVNNPDPIHPNSKIELAKRFATAVLAGVYGIGDADAQTAPTVSSWSVEGSKIVLTFDNVGADGLKILNNSPDLTGFAIAGSDRVFVKATAKIVGTNKVELTSDAVTDPVAATYAWTSFNMSSNLANAAGIPAVPYRTDKVASTYYLSMDWADFDTDEIWVALTTLDAGFQPAYTTSDNAGLTVDTQDKLEGQAAICLAYTLTGSGVAELAPVLNYHGMVNQYAAYTGLTLHVKNPDSRTKELSLEITASGETYYATVITGETLGTAYELPAGEYAEYTFNLARLVNAEGKVLADSAPVLKTITALTLCISDTQSGSVLFDNAYPHVDKLPTPGSEGDDVIEVEDTTPGSLDADSNMWLSAAESTSGWSAIGADIEIDVDKYTQGNSSVGATAAGGVLKQIAYVPGVSLDISEYDYLEFDVYFSNMKWFNASNMMFEMTSSGGPDVDSNRWMKGQMNVYAPELYNAAVAETDEPGWYHVKLTIDSPQGNGRGSMDTTCFNFFRFYSIDAPADTPDYEIRFDNMKFTKKDADRSDTSPVSRDPAYGQVIDDESMWLTDGEILGYWQATGAQVQLSTAFKTQGDSSVSVTAQSGTLRQFAYVPDFSIDISDYQYLEFDAYFTNLDWYFATDSTMFELTSSGTSDVESIRFTKSSMLEACAEFAQDVEAGEGGGKWYHFKLKLAAPHSEVRGGLDKTRFNFFRFYTVQVADGTPDYTLYLDNLKFTKDPSGMSEVKDPSYGKIIDSSAMWMTDGDSLGYWHATGTDVLLSSLLKTQGNNSISATAKNGVLKQIAFVPDYSIDISAYQYLEFDVYFSNLDWYFAGDSTMFELTSAGTSDVESSRFTKSSMLEACPEFAADVEAGCGGGKWYHFKLNLDIPHAKVNGGLNKTKFNFFRFYVVGVAADTPDFTIYLDNLRFTKGEGVSPLEKTDEYIIINNADSAAGWSSPGQEVMVDTQNKVSGIGSVTVTAKGGILKELVYRPSESIDLTGYNYLEFDLFLSDITCLSTSSGFMVELTSSGTCDVASNRYMLSTILLTCPELAEDMSNGDIGNKWYHFCLPLDKPQNQAGGGLDMTAFNYFRIYFIGSPEGTPDCVVNLDNLMVTVSGRSTSDNTPTTENQIVFPGGGSATGKNIGNKLNGGLLAEVFAPLSTGLVTAVIAMGGVLVLLLACAITLLILSKKKKHFERP